MKTFKAGKQFLVFFCVRSKKFLADTNIVKRFQKLIRKKGQLFSYPFQWEQRESNPRPSACKADALNQLSYAPKHPVFKSGMQRYYYFSNLQTFCDIFALRTKNSLGNKHTAEGTIGPVMRGVEGFDDRNRG